MQLPVPETGNRSFERVLKAIELEEVVGPAQITKFVAPRLRTSDSDDPFGVVYPPGMLQHRDFQDIRAKFEYPDFIVSTIRNHTAFDSDEAKVFQFQKETGASRFVYGVLVTDSLFNLVDFCLGTSRQEQRRTVLKPLIRAICTPASVQVRFH